MSYISNEHLHSSLWSVPLVMILAALSLAASQFDPHLVGNFIRDRASYVYAILILRSISSAERGSDNCDISVLTALVLTLISAIYLIYFIHNVAQSIQVDSITHRIRLEFQRAVAREYPDCDTPNW
ncbi:DUF2254 family protein [Microbulbifer sp. ZKSA006]|uniref:DUF2254 family protein n=1 Tax=Microbulbifer sp. ZKSA006 TaxID=3243390 RepID=UPI00403941B2